MLQSLFDTISSSPESFSCVAIDIADPSSALYFECPDIDTSEILSKADSENRNSLLVPSLNWAEQL